MGMEINTNLSLRNQKCNISFRVQYTYYPKLLCLPTVNCHSDSSMRVHCDKLYGLGRRKPVFGICDQVRLSPAFSATETSKNNEHLNIVSLYKFKLRLCCVHTIKSGFLANRHNSYRNTMGKMSYTIITDHQNSI